MSSCRVRDIGETEFTRQLAGDGIGIRIGPFNAHIRMPVAGTGAILYRYYSAFPIVGDDEIYSFRVRVDPVRTFPRLHRRMVRFSVDGQVPHEDLPIEQAVAVLEWGINLVIALRSHAYLMLHTAVIERNGKVLLMPAAPGFGKTTLCAALAYRGWRLLSDEFGLVRPDGLDFVPIPRPMALKNESIGVIKRYLSEAFVGPSIPGTRKGTVAHVAPPMDSVESQNIKAPAAWVIFPRWVEGVSLELDELPRADGFMKLAMNAFNYELLGEAGFRTIRGIVDRADCYKLVYSDLDEAVDTLTELVDRNAAG